MPSMMFCGVNAAGGVVTGGCTPAGDSGPW